MNKCTKCGKESIYSESCLIGSKDMLSCVKLEGAATVGVCGECASPYIRKGLNRNLLIAIGVLLFGLFMLLATITDNFGNGSSNTVSPLWSWAIIIGCLGASLKFFLAYSAAMKQTGKDNPVTAEMIDGEVLGKLLASVGEVGEGVIFSWSALNAKRGATAEDFDNPAFVAKIRAPFRVGTQGKIEFRSLSVIESKVDLSVFFPMDKSLDKEGQELIKQAIEHYQKETIK